MLRRTERMKTNASGSDYTPEFFKEYIDETLYKLNIQHVESHPSTPRKEESKELSKANGLR